jgi:hypothetical protein
MKHQALRIDFADGFAHLCLVGRDHASEQWQHERTLSRRAEDDTEGTADAARAWGSKLALKVLS